MINNIDQAKSVADKCLPCTDEFYEGAYQGALMALNSIKSTYTIPVGNLSPEEAKKNLAELMSEYREDVVFNNVRQLELESVRFTEEDIIDKDRLHSMIEKEARGIHANESSAKGRDYDTIYFFVKQGKIAELYLIENFDYKEADIKYHDLMDDEGVYTEVKAYDIWNSDAPSVKKDLKRIRTEGWNKSSWYLLFQCKYGEYTFLEKIKVYE